ncbi:NSFL1 cofactor p47-like isoform X2 [Oratosquilla oratoria]|uniref:NSFL1 cofactor p47-like isoform X2 n=1 Tax=Oratosquilla oratoria TaxID=337810 RepID=UPI003F7582E5
MADRDNLIAQFSAVSGVDSERARFFLESAAWNLESALSSFYEEGEGGEEDLGDRPEAEGAPSTPQRPTLQPPQGRFNMMDGDSSDDEGQAFYAGGSEHSGQQVLGPSKKGKGDVVAQLFKSAKEHGAEVLDSTKNKKGKSATFKGTGYRLGMTDDDTQVIPGRSQEDRTPRDVMLKMWKTGFTVDGGPLRLYEDPGNAEFLNSVRRSEVPLELIKEARGGEVFINMADHRHEDYVPTKSALKAFVGTGHTLGSPAPNVVGQVAQTGTAGGAIGASVVEGTPSDPKACEQSAQSEIKVDTSQPTTNIQVRLTDGTRLVLKLNHNHTVGDIRRYICTARPTYQASPFALMTTFPHAELCDDSKTVVEAKLLNSAIVVKNK